MLSFGFGFGLLFYSISALLTVFIDASDGPMKATQPEWLPQHPGGASGLSLPEKLRHENASSTTRTHAVSRIPATTKYKPSKMHKIFLCHVGKTGGSSIKSVLKVKCTENKWERPTRKNV